MTRFTVPLVSFVVALAVLVAPGPCAHPLPNIPATPAVHRPAAGAPPR